MTIAETEIERVLKADIIAANLSWPVIWPNHTLPNTKPFILFEIIRVNRRDDTLAGEMTISRGQLIATPITKVGIDSEAGNEKADEVAGLFPMGRRIAVPGGEIVILKPADIREGFRQHTEWRTPVIVDFEAS